MPKKELLIRIDKIRDWTMKYYKDPRIPKADFALKVACCAKALERDEFVNLVIEYLT